MGRLNIPVHGRDGAPGRRSVSACPDACAVSTRCRATCAVESTGGGGTTTDIAYCHHQAWLKS